MRPIIHSVLLIFVIATPLLGNEATVSWNPHPESRVTGYKIYYGKASRTYTSSVDVGSVTQYTLRGLESGTWYFAVTAYTPGGLESGYSREVSKSIQEDVRPLEILTLDVSLVTHASAVIQWTTNKESRGEIEYGTSTDYGSRVSSNNGLRTSQSVVIEGLSPSTTYHFRLKAGDSAGKQKLSSDEAFVTAPPPDSVVAAASSFRPLAPGGDIEAAGIAVTNQGSSTAVLRLTARDATGAAVAGDGILNPVALQLEPGGQVSGVDNQIFGEGFAGKLLDGWIQVDSTSARTPGFFLMFDTELSVLDGTNLLTQPLVSFVLPALEEQGYTLIMIQNPNPQPALVKLELVSSTGAVRQSVNLRIAPMGSLIDSITSDILFPEIELDPLDYVRGSSNIGTLPIQMLGRRGSQLKALHGQDANRFAGVVYAAQYATGDAYSSHISVVNLDPWEGIVNATMVADGGQAENTRVLKIPAHGKMRIDDEVLFGQRNPGNIQGYVRIEGNVDMAGYLHIEEAESGRFGSLLPLTSQLETSMVFSQLASNDTYFTGIAMVNPNPANATATLSVHDSDGRIVASTTLTVPARGRIVRVLTEYFPALSGQERSSGYVRLESDVGLASFALFGTKDFSVLSSVPSQGIR
jgi:hypothetical protein